MRLLAFAFPESDRRGIESARRRGMAGATVTGGVAGFGKNQQLHTARIFELSSDLPMVVTIIDTAEAIARKCPSNCTKTDTNRGTNRRILQHDK